MNVAVLEALFSDGTAYDVIEGQRNWVSGRQAQAAWAGAAALAPDVN